MAAVTLRRARPSDLDDLIELAAEYRATEDHETDRDRVSAGFAGLLADDTYGVVWLAIDTSVEAGADCGRAVGYAVVTWGWSIEIGGLDVVLDEIFSRRRGAGIGSALIDHLENDCRERGVRRIFLETELANERARVLYERHGFVADDSVWMAKELS